MIKHLMWGFILLLTLSQTLASASEHSNDSAISNYQQQAIKLKLADAPAWHSLLHYKKSSFGVETSQAKTASFFVAENGRTDVEAELLATLSSLFSNDLNERHSLCRFPARAHWLMENLAISREQLPHPDCKKFDHFFTEINPAGTTLIFPVAYLNSPSSMFGHTFLRIDKKGQTEATRLMAWSINYAANANTKDGEIIFAWKGLFGGYPGNFSVLPYYLKVQEYNDWESRDVWEFGLNLSTQETEQLVRHVWELMDVEFDYYFLKENCSYRVLELIDAVRPEHQFQAKFFASAIPVDTVRVIEEAQMVTSAEFRPSAMKLVRNGLEQLNPEEQTQVLALATADENSDEWRQAVDQLAKNSTTRNQAVLEVAYEYLRLRVQLGKLTREGTARRSLKLLQMRNTLAAGSALAPVKPPTVRDDQAHHSEQISMAAGQHDSFNYIDLSWRPAFHALTDPHEGFPVGAQIKFLDTHFRAWEKDSPENITLERIDIITVTALTQHDHFFQPWSWQVNVGGRRQEVANSTLARPLVGFFDLSFGLNKALFNDVSAYVLLGGATEFAHTMERGFDVGPQLELGMLGYYASLFSYSGQWQLSAKQIDWSGDEYSKQKVLQLNHSLNLNRDLSFQLKLERNFRFEHWGNEASLGFSYFY